MTGGVWSSVALSQETRMSRSVAMSWSVIPETAAVGVQ